LGADAGLSNLDADGIVAYTSDQVLCFAPFERKVFFNMRRIFLVAFVACALIVACAKSKQDVETGGGSTVIQCVSASGGGAAQAPTGSGSVNGGGVVTDQHAKTGSGSVVVQTAAAGGKCPEGTIPAAPAK
jgi:hypothetical protein